MLQLAKDHGPHLVQSVMDVKTTVSAAVSGAGIATIAVTEPEPVAIGLDEWSTIAVIFSCTATALFMVSNFVLNLIKISKELKDDKCDTK